MLTTKLIAAPRRLTFGMRRRLHEYRPELPFYAARPIDTILSKHSPGFELLNESINRVVCFSPANIPDGLTYHLKNFKPRDGCHATGLQFITDNLDMVILNNNTSGQRPGWRNTAGEKSRPFLDSPRIAYVCLPKTIIKLNSTNRIELVFTSHLFRPAAEYFLTRLSETGVVPSFNSRYQEIRYRFAELLWVDYAKFLRESVKYASAITDQWIYNDLNDKITAAYQKIAEYNTLLGLAEDNFELVPFKSGFSFSTWKFLLQTFRRRYVEPRRS